MLHVRRHRMFTSLAALLVICGISNANASGAGPQTLNLQGRIVRPDSSAVEAASVDFVLQVRSNGAESCVLFEETHTLNMTGTDGVFSIKLGTGSRAGSNFKDTSTLSQAFDNSAALISSLACASGTTYDPLPSDARKLRVTFDEGSPSGAQTLAQDLTISAVPYSLYADSLQGKTPSNFVQTISALESTPGTTQTRVNQIIDTDWASLNALLAGTSTLYAKAVPTGAVDYNNQRIVNVANPTSPQDAATKDYSDTKIGGNAAVVGVLAPGDVGKALTWDGTKWVAQTPSTTDATKLPLAGGTMTGAINMGAQNITNAGHIQLGLQKTLLLGRYDNTQETALVSTLLAADNGRVWFNTDASKQRLWNGTAAVDVGSSTLVVGTTAGTAMGADAVPNCTGAQKLQMSLGPTYSWTCVTDSTTDANAVAKAGDTMTGVLNLPANGLIAGTNQLVLSGGNVGIGTAAPSGMLHVSGTNAVVNISGAGTAGLNFSNGTAANTPPVINFAKFGSAGLPNGANFLGEFAFNAGNSGWTFNRVAAVGAILETTPTDSSMPTSLYFHTTGTGSVIGTERMRITSAGNVGIGTTAPTFTVDATVNQAGVTGFQAMNTSSSGAARLNLVSDGGRNLVLTALSSTLGNSASMTSNYGMYVGTSAAASLTLQTSSNPRLTVDSAGNVGIGTTSPGYPLTVTSSNTTATIQGQSSGTGAGVRGYSTTASSIGVEGYVTNSSSSALKGTSTSAAGNGLWVTNTSAGYSIYSDTGKNYFGGNVGIGTTSPARLLHVQGPMRVQPAGLPASPAAGDIAIDSGAGNALKWHDGSGWQTVGTSTGGVSSFNSRTGAVVPATNDYAWAQIDKTTSSLADLTTRSASDLSSGTLPDARLSSNVPLKNSANTFSVGGQLITNDAAGTKPLVIRGVAAQTAPMQEWQNSASAVLYGLNATGAPTATTDLTTKGYVDTAILTAGNYVLKAGDTMTGTLNLPANGLVAGTNQFVLNGGNVGIGTTTPGYELDVAGQIRATGPSSGSIRNGLYIGNTAAPSATNGAGISFVSGSSSGALVQMGWNAAALTDASLRFSTVGSGTLSEKVRINSNGNVGIGTTAPVSKLQLSGTGIVEQRFTNDVTGHTSADGTLVGIDGGLGFQINNLEAGPITIYSSGTERMKFLAGGNIGVGVTNPTSVLHLKAGTATAGSAPLKLTSGVNLTTPEAGAIEFDGTNLYYTNSANARQTIATSASSLTIGQTTGTAMGADAIPNCTSVQKLQMSAGPTFAWTCVADGSQWTTTGSDVYYNSGKVGIGTTAPTTKLHVVGDTFIDGGLTLNYNAYLANTLTNDTNPLVTVGSGAYGFGRTATGSHFALFSANDFRFRVNGSSTDLMTIKAGGNVGIGTTEPRGLFDISPTATATDGSGVYLTSQASTVAFKKAGDIRLETPASYYAGNIYLTSRSGYTHIGPVTSSVGTVTQSGTAVTGVGTAFAAGMVGSTISVAGGTPQTIAAVGSATTLTTATGATAGSGSLYEIRSSAGLVVANGGNVGIGTATPTAALAIRAGTAAAGTAPLKLTAGTNLTTPEAGAIEFDGTNLYYTNSSNARQTLATSAGASQWTTTGSDIYYTAGKVGIGTATPGALLHLANATNSNVYLSGNVGHGITTVAPTNVGLVINGGATSGASMTGYSDGGSSGLSIEGTLGHPSPTAGVAAFTLSASKKNGTGLQALAASDTAFNFLNRSTKLLTIMGDGNVGIGTTAPVSKLDVAGTLSFGGAGTGSISGGGYLTLDGPAGGTLIRYAGAERLNIDNTVKISSHGGSWVTLSNGATEVVRVTGGNVGIGTTTPAQKLEVNGNVLAASYLYSSDRNLKTRIEPIKNALGKIDQLNGVTYDWRRPASEDANRRQIGVIAQDVEKVFPEAVVTAKDGLKRVDYPALVAPIIEAIKDLYAKFLDQSAKVSFLEKRQNALADQNEMLEKQIKQMQKFAEHVCRTQPTLCETDTK